MALLRLSRYSIIELVHYYFFCNLIATVIRLNLSWNMLSLPCLCIFGAVPPPTITTSPSGPIQGAMVGNPQMIQCTVSTVSGVESSSVMISWMGPGGDTITNDSRVTINPTTSSGNTYASSIQFMYLMEGDEGTYMCNVMILETSGSSSVVLETLTSKSYMYLIFVYPSML